MDIKIVIATHKKYDMPSDNCYLPIHVGSVGKTNLGYTRDDAGENISDKNPYYCELTGLYWAWKNLDADYIGLAHYRRHFSYKKKGDKWERILTDTELKRLLSDTDVILPKKRKYYIETMQSHYAHTFDPKHLDMTRDIIADNSPEYLASFDKVLNRRSAHMFNMFVMKKKYADAYCQWLFSTLEELEKCIDLSSMTAFEARLFGRISEMLLDVWIDKNGVRYIEVGYIQMESVNWVKKGSTFFMAKFGNKKYERSF